ncbi:MAG: phenylacetate--CoA ligase family protein [Solirubrobacterales bacterium]|nr:phenylacetate--CoA ligase family protein [Solirubrobacterales bacterium]
MSHAGDAYGLTRERHIARFAELLPELQDRIEWPVERLAVERLRALRALVATARERSPWHRERLGDVEPQELTEANLKSLPVMTKADLMDNFDAIVTDRRVSLNLCEGQLALSARGSYLLGEYSVVASGGSSGRRGGFIYGWDAWATCYASIVRFVQRDWESDPRLADVERNTAVVAASAPTHLSAALGRTFSSPANPRHLLPVTWPLEVIVDGLNELQPTVLMAYSSFLPRLILEARAGRLSIAPRRVIAISEPLLTEIRAAAEATWDAPVACGYGMSEGLITGSCGHAIHLPDDLCLVEPVTVDRRRTPPGQRSDRVLVTNLYNPVLPLIRFEVTDEITVLDGPCPCGAVFRRISDPQGRLDETFTYDRLSMHPHVFRSVLATFRQVIEYQVLQSPHGAEVRIVTCGDLDPEALRVRLEAALTRLGLDQPLVTVRPVASLQRHPSGKLQRFVPLQPDHTLATPDRRSASPTRPN